MDETYVKVAGGWRYVYRAVDQHGQVIDVLVSKHRDLAAARRFFTRAIGDHGQPCEVTTDLAPPLLRVVSELLPEANHDTAQFSNNRVEADHGRLKARLRPMRGLKRDPLRVEGDPRTCVRPEPPPRARRTRSRRSTPALAPRGSVR